MTGPTGRVPPHPPRYRRPPEERSKDSSVSTPCSPPTIPLPAQTMPDLRFPPFPESRSTLGVRGGPLVALVALLAGVVALCAIAVIGAGWPDWWVPTGLALVVGRDRVALALSRFRRVRPGRRGARTRHRVPLATVLATVAALVLGWAVPAAVATVGGVEPRTDAVVRDAGASAAAEAEELHGALRNGLAVVERAAALPTGAAVTDPRTTAAQVLAEEPRFRSVAVVDGDGQPI